MSEANKPEAGAAGKGARKEGNTVILASGEKRVDYIKRRFKEGAKRGEIAKELGVPYQIVFASTKTKKEAKAGVEPEQAKAVEESQPA